MRIFGKLFQISRRLSCYAKSRRHSYLLYSSAYSPSASNLRLARNYINSRNFGTKSGDDDGLEKTLATLSIIREHARQIEAFTDNLTGSTLNSGKTQIDPKQSTPRQEIESNEESDFWPNLGPIEKTEEQNATDLYDGLEIVMAEEEVNRVPVNDSFDVVPWNESKKTLFVNVPDSLEEKLRQMAISSMQLAFEMDMTNIKDAILLHATTRGIDLFHRPKPKSLKDPTLSLTTCLEVDTPKQTHTIPLNFNALIQGTVEIDPSRFSPEQLVEIKVPEFNEYVTAIAANICSTALQKGFPAETNRKYSTSVSTGGGGSKPPRNPHIICVREGDKGCISPGNADNPNFMPQSAGALSSPMAGPAPGSKDASCGKAPSILSMSDIIGELGARGLMSCKAYTRAIAEAEKRRKLMKEKKSECKPKPKNICVKSEPKKSTCPPKKESTCEPKKAESKSCGAPKKESTPKCASKKESTCGPPKEQPKTLAKTDPCAKILSKKADPCVKSDSKKADPCAKSEPKKSKSDSQLCSPPKKATSCAKPESKKADPCAKSDSKKADPCAKSGSKKADPCAKSGSKKADPCAKNEPKKSKSDSQLCSPPKKASSCAKPESKKADPCAKSDSKKADPCAKSDSKKADPCAKSGSKKADPCAKNEPKKSKSDSQLCSPPKKASSCAKPECKKANPCAKSESKKADPCAKLGSKKADPCAKSGSKKADPCAKNEPKKSKSDSQLCSPPKKASSCAKPESKKADPCAKSGSKKADPCAKNEPKKSKSDSQLCSPPKKASSCAKPESKKADPCAKSDSKKADPCAKLGSKKADPCAKSGSKKADPCPKSECKKADPCAKLQCNKADPCAKLGSKKADPCANLESIKADPKKSKSASQLCGAAKKKETSPKCEPKKESTKSCGAPKKAKSESQICGPAKAEPKKCGPPKKEISGAKKESKPCGPAKADPKSCGPPKKESSCAKPQSKKSDPCAKSEPKKSKSDSQLCSPPKKASSCAKPESKKADPCAKPDSKKADPCAKSKPKKSKSDSQLCSPPKKASSCAKPESKKADPCAKPDSKKADPCAKPESKKAAAAVKSESKKKGSCAKIELKKQKSCADSKPKPSSSPAPKSCGAAVKPAQRVMKKDPCANEKKKDPCKKEHPCERQGDCKPDDPCKQDPCVKNKGNNCNKEPDCKKVDSILGVGIVKVAPSRNQQAIQAASGGSKKGDDPCKEDPCKNKDPCKKEDPCKVKEPPRKKKEEKPKPCKSKGNPCAPLKRPKKREDNRKPSKPDPCAYVREDPCGPKKPPPCGGDPNPCRPVKPRPKPKKPVSDCSSATTSKDSGSKKCDSPDKRPTKSCGQKDTSSKKDGSGGADKSKKCDSGKPTEKTTRSASCPPPEKQPEQSSKCNTTDPCKSSKKSCNSGTPKAQEKKGDPRDTCEFLKKATGSKCGSKEEKTTRSESCPPPGKQPEQSSKCNTNDPCKSSKKEAGSKSCNSGTTKDQEKKGGPRDTCEFLKKATGSKCDSKEEKTTRSESCPPPEKQPEQTSKCNTNDPCKSSKKEGGSKSCNSGTTKDQEKKGGPRDTCDFLKKATASKIKTGEKPQCDSDKTKKRSASNPPSGKRAKQTSKCNTEDPCKGTRKKTRSSSSSKKAETKCKTPEPKSKSGCDKDKKANASKGGGSGATKAPIKCIGGSDKKAQKKDSKCGGGSAKKVEKKDSKCGGGDKEKKQASKCVSKKPSKSGSESGSKKDNKSKTDCPNTTSKSKPSTKPNCPKTTGANNCKKSFSTSALCVTSQAEEGSPIKRSCSSTTITLAPFLFPENILSEPFKTAVPISLLKRRFRGLSTGSFRLFSSDKKNKDKELTGKCLELKQKFPKTRKAASTKKKDWKPKECWITDADHCPEPRCKTGKDKGNKENKKLLLRLINTCTTGQIKIHRKYLCTSAALKKRYDQLDDYDNNDNCEYYGRQDSKALRNEVVKVTEHCKVERMFEEVPCYSDYDVLIRTGAIAISGSDVHVYETGGSKCPTMTIGHDATGVIEKVGKCICNLKPGDRVVVESGLSCGICDFCKRGAYNMCSQLIYNGFFAKYQVHPADLCHKLPISVSFEEGTLTQTLALGCQACFRAHITPTTNVLVIGSCPTAVSAAICARAIGAMNVCLTCTMHHTLETVRKNFGINYVHYKCETPVLDVLQSIYCRLLDWPEVVINCAISESTMKLAVMALKPCGTCVLAECDTENASFNALDVLMKNLKLIPSFRSTNMFPTAIHLMKTGQAPMRELIIRSYYWPQVDMAFRAAQHESNVGNRKIIVKCAEDDYCT